MSFQDFDDGIDFNRKVELAIERSRLILEEEKRVQHAENVPHSYGNKFSLVEMMANMTIVGIFTAMEETMGLTENGLKTMLEWSGKSMAVSLRLKAEERCVFDRTEKRQVSDVAYVRDYGAGNMKTTDKTVTTITEYFWKFNVQWELVAFAGSHFMVLQKRRGNFELMTRTERSPLPALTVRDGIDVNLSWLLKHVQTRETSWTISREAKGCHTPRRNTDTEEALQFLKSLCQWVNRVQMYFRVGMFPPQSGVTLGSINDDSVFIPVVPLFVKSKRVGTANKAPFPPSGLVALGKMSSGQDSSSPLLDDLDMNRFLDEERRSLAEKRGELAKAFPSSVEGGSQLISTMEVQTLLGLSHAKTLAICFEAGLNYLEDMLRKQLVSAIGKEVTPVDFANYMVYHNRRAFREEYRPRAFCYAIRRPDHDPEGILSIEQQLLGDGSPAEPIQTFVKELKLEAPMKFALQPGVEVAFSGDAYIHGSMMHSFSGDTGLQLQLCARARPFSSFLVLVGRVAGVGFFDPQYGVIVQNKDDVTIPLDLETIPSAGEFKRATVSISPEQQAFSKMFRGMQLASTLFGVCVLQIKPQLEKLLRLTNDSLTKEIRLTQDLLQIFIEYQIPADLLSFGGPSSASEESRLTSVKRNVRLAQLMVDLEKLDQQIQGLEVAEKKVRDDAAAAAAVMVKAVPGMEGIKLLRELFHEGFMTAVEFDQRRLEMINSMTCASGMEGIKLLRELFHEGFMKRAEFDQRRLEVINSMTSGSYVGTQTYGHSSGVDGMYFSSNKYGDQPQMLNLKAGSGMTSMAEMDAALMIQERNRDIQHLEREMAELSQVFHDLNNMVSEQGTSIETATAHIEACESVTQSSTKELGGDHSREYLWDDGRGAGGFASGEAWGASSSHHGAWKGGGGGGGDDLDDLLCDLASDQSKSAAYTPSIHIDAWKGGGGDDLDDLLCELPSDQSRSAAYRNASPQAPATGDISDDLHALLAELMEEDPEPAKPQLPRGAKLGRMPVSVRNEAKPATKPQLIFEYARRNDLKSLDEVLRMGASVNCRDESTRDTPLMVACRAGQRQSIFYLVEQRADVNAQNVHGSTALHELTKERRDDLAIWLVKHGADVHVQDRWGYSAIDRAPALSRRGLQKVAADQYLTVTKPAKEALHKAQREALSSQREALLKERDELDASTSDVQGGADPSSPLPLAPSGSCPIEWTALPTQLDAALEANDPNSAVRPTIIKVAPVWTRRSQPHLLSSSATTTTTARLGVSEQKLEKERVWDLLDALTRSGGLPIQGAQFHVVLATTHCFDKSLIDTLVKNNVNPIEKLESSSLMLASVVHGVDKSQLFF